MKKRTPFVLGSRIGIRGSCRLTSLLLVLAVTGTACGQTWDPKLTETWEPEPALVTPGESGLPPSDAIVLFDGSTLDAWEGGAWTLRDGAMTSGSGPIQTKQSFGDVQLHVEWRTPTPPKGES